MIRRGLVQGILLFACLAAPEPGFCGEPLSLELALTSSRFRPGRRVEAEAYLVNQSGVPVLVAAHREGWRGFTVSKDGSPARSFPPRYPPEKGDGVFSGRFHLPPGRRLLLQVVRLHEAFDVSREGGYELGFAYEVSEETCGIDSRSSGREALERLRSEGCWTGRVEAPKAPFRVDPEAPLDPVGRPRRLEARLGAREGGLFTLDRGGASGAYPGLVFSVLRQGRKIGTMRYSQLLDAASGGWLEGLLPADLAGEPEAGDLAEAVVDRSYWMKSQLAPDSGTPMDGLGLELAMDRTELAEGEQWTGSLAAVNRGDAAVTLEPEYGLTVNLYPVECGPPGIVQCMGAGFGPDPEALKKGCVTLEPGERRILRRFEGCDWNSQFGGLFGSRALAFDFPAGTYRLSFEYRRDATDLAWLGMPGLWTGRMESNVAVMKVVPGEGAGEIAGGLRLRLGTFSGRNSFRGGIQFENAGDREVLVDYRAGLVMEFRTPGGELAAEMPLETNHSPPSGKRRLPPVRIVPGGRDSFTSFMIRDALVIASPMAFKQLKPGEYLLSAVYRREPAGDGGGEASPGVWTGTLRSNTVTLKVPVGKGG